MVRLRRDHVDGDVVRETVGEDRGERGQVQKVRRKVERAVGGNGSWEAVNAW